jgi:hypothetical protein
MTFTLTASMFIFFGCQTIYVSDMETSYFTKNCPTHSILIMSCNEYNPQDLNNGLCAELNNMFTVKGYKVSEYCPVKYDSVEYSNIVATRNPEFILCIIPQKLLTQKSGKSNNLPYRIEALYRRDSGKVSSVYLGKINISYTEDKKSEILKNASGKIYSAIVDNNVLK